VKMFSSTYLPLRKGCDGGCGASYLVLIKRLAREAGLNAAEQ
jgi:hypothetical protein